MSLDRQAYLQEGIYAEIVVGMGTCDKMREDEHNSAETGGRMNAPDRPRGQPKYVLQMLDM